MSAPSAELSHGGTALLLIEGPEITRTRTGIDRIVAEYHSATRHEFNPGESFPDYAGCKVDECVHRADGSDWIHRLTGVGVAGSKSRRMLISRPQRTLEGFDLGQEVWLDSNTGLYLPGRRMTGYGNMVCDTPDPEPLEESGWHRITMNFRGLIGSKPTKRTISTNAEMLELENHVMLGPGGWTTGRKARIGWPRVTVTFSYVTSYTPIIYIPKQGESAPAELYPVFTMSFTTNAETTWHWPNGWRRISFTQDIIPGTSITHTTDVWEFQQIVTF